MDGQGRPDYVPLMARNVGAMTSCRAQARGAKSGAQGPIDAERVSDAVVEPAARDEGGRDETAGSASRVGVASGKELAEARASNQELRGMLQRVATEKRVADDVG